MARQGPVRAKKRSRRRRGTGKDAVCGSTGTEEGEGDGDTEIDTEIDGSMQVDEEKQKRFATLVSLGCVVLPCAVTDSGTVDLLDALSRLPGLGVESLLVEGGASVLTSFVERAEELVDLVWITVCPLFVGGLHVMQKPQLQLPRLRQSDLLRVGNDFVVWGTFRKKH